jgi:hypothetical protein
VLDETSILEKLVSALKIWGHKLDREVLEFILDLAL